MKPLPVILAVCGISVLAVTGISFFLANYTVHGARQTLEHSKKWQDEHYNTSFFDKLDKEEYIVTAEDGYELHTMLCKNPVPTDKYVIITHGYTDTRYGAVKYMKIYLDLGYNCIIYDLRGHGANKPSICTYSIREAKDLRCMIEDAQARYRTADGNPIVPGLHGESLGAATTAAVMQYHPDVAWAVCDCGFADIVNVLEGGLKNMMHLPGFLVRTSSWAASIRYGFNYYKARPIDALKENHIPMLFIHGAEDDFILPSNSVRMADATAGYSEVHKIEGAGHAKSVLTDPALYEKYLTAFIHSMS